MGVDMQDFLINWNAGPFGLVLRPELGSDMPPSVVRLLPEQSVAKLSGVRTGDLLISVNGKKTAKLGYEKVVKMLYKENLPLILHFRTPKVHAPARGDHAGGGSVSGGSVRSGGYSSVHGSMLEAPPRQRAASTSQQSMALAAYSAPAAHQYHQQQQQQQQQQQMMRQLQLQRRPPDFDAHSIASSSSSRALPRGDAQGERKQFTAVWERGGLGISFRAYSPRVNVPCVDFIGKRGQGRNMERVCLNDVLIAINGEKTKTLGVERVLRWLLVIEKPVVLRFHSSSNRVPQGSGGAHEPLTSSLVSPPPPPLRVLYEASPPPPPRSNASAYPPAPAHDSGRNPAPGLDDFDLLVNAQPELRRHQSNSTEYVRTDRARGFSNGSILHANGPRDEPPPPQQHGSNHHHVLYEPELERPRQRRPSNAHNALPSREPQDRHTRATTITTTATATARNDDMSLDDAIRVFVRSSGKPVGECMFAGGPILAIREGSMQAKLLVTFAKACLAKEATQQAVAGGADPPPTASLNEPAAALPSSQSGDFTRDHAAEPQRLTTGSALSRHQSHQFLSYGGAAHEHAERSRSHSSDAVAMPMLPPSRSANQPLQPQVIAVVPPPPVGAARPAPQQVPSEDFISLKDYLAQGEDGPPGTADDREGTTSSRNSASTLAPSLHGGDDDLLAAGSHLVAHPIALSSSSSSSAAAAAAQSVRVDNAAGSSEPHPARGSERSPPTATECKPAASDMIALTAPTPPPPPPPVPAPETRPQRLSAPFDPVQREIDAMTHIERSSLLHPLIAELYGFLPDLHNLVKDKPVASLLMKKDMMDEIQDILQSLQMEEHFERHSHLGVGSMPPPLSPTDLATESTLHPSGKQRCYQCGKTGELADLALEGGRRELYCQDCWEVFFYSEEQLHGEEEGDSEASATPRSIRDSDSADDAYKYSFHDSSASRADMMLGPWRYLNGSGGNGGGDGASSIRDSTTTIGSTLTDRGEDEVWL
ncbi:hypothetical protein PybrP1_005276 [[Pythium] brassicae (nom. inval.)]|nr:hypothetical protein PybrP1_005276 [[Pythium] brassicae (nom. inval.)]